MQPLQNRPNLLQEAITLLGLVSVGQPVSSRWIKARDRFAVKAGIALESDKAASAPEGNNEQLPTATTARV